MKKRSLPVRSMKNTSFKIKGKDFCFSISCTDLIKENIQVIYDEFLIVFTILAVLNQTYFPLVYVNERGDCSLAVKEYLIPKILKKKSEKNKDTTLHRNFTCQSTIGTVYLFPAED